MARRSKSRSKLKSLSPSRGFSTLHPRCRGCHRLEFLFDSFPLFFSGWVLAYFFGHSSFHRIHWHSSHFAFTHQDSLDFTQPTQICSLGLSIRFRRLSVFAATFWCQSFKASIASKGYPCMALTYPPILLFLFFFTLDIYRPDGRTLRQFTMMTRTLTNGRNLTDGRTNAVFYYYCHST